MNTINIDVFKVSEMKVYGIVAARSGSKGLPNKNIRPLAGHPLMAYSIAFARALNCDKVICSTDSEEYAEIARQYGAEVPFMRSEAAASDTAMEQDILRDLSARFDEASIEAPDIIVWLRPTFVFRELAAVLECIDALKKNPEWTSARTVCESEARLYTIQDDNSLLPNFDDHGKSMIRRQEIGVHYKVFSTDVIRFKDRKIDDDFLGRKVYARKINKICGLDIDDREDFDLIEAVILGNRALVEPYIFI